MNGKDGLRIRAPRVDEFEPWFALYDSYATSVDLPVTRSTATGVWQWICSATHGVEAVVAERAGELVGFAHYRPFPRTLDANQACYLDDLFVAEEERGHGTARALVDEVVRISSERGWTHVRWVTDKDNARAQRFYDKFAEDMDLVTYRVLD